MNERKLDFKVCFEPSYSIQSCNAEVSEMSYEGLMNLFMDKQQNYYWVERD